MDIRKMMKTLSEGMPTIDDRAAPIPQIVRYLLERDGHHEKDIDKLFRLESLVVLQFIKFGELLEMLESGRVKQAKLTTPTTPPEERK